MSIFIILTKFSLGQVVSTPGALEKAEQCGVDLHDLLKRHAVGDWGDLCDEDRQANDYALEHKLRLVSYYKVSEEDEIWIITEWDRSVTTFLLPSEC